MKRLVLFGDSLLGRVGIDLTNRIKKTIPGVEVYNCASGGFNSRDAKERVDYIAQLKPDYVVLSLGANDSFPEEWSPVVPTGEYEENLKTIIRAFDKSLVVAWLAPPVGLREGQEDFVKELNEGLVKYHNVAKKVCDEMGARYIDSFVAYQPLIDQGIDYHKEDKVHLSDEGYDPFIQELAKILV